MFDWLFGDSEEEKAAKAAAAEEAENQLRASNAAIAAQKAQEQRDREAVRAYHARRDKMTAAEVRKEDEKWERDQKSMNDWYKNHPNSGSKPPQRYRW
jgi:hypothetical protein